MLRSADTGFMFGVSVRGFATCLSTGFVCCAATAHTSMDEESGKYDILQIDETVRDHQLERLAKVRSTRDKGAVSTALDKLKIAARDNENTMPYIIDAVSSYATVEEISVALRDVYGIYEEPAF